MLLRECVERIRDRWWCSSREDGVIEVDRTRRAPVRLSGPWRIPRWRSGPSGIPPLTTDWPPRPVWVPSGGPAERYAPLVSVAFGYTLLAKTSELR